MSSINETRNEKKSLYCDDSNKYINMIAGTVPCMYIFFHYYCSVFALCYMLSNEINI